MPAGPITCRPVQRPEIESALRLILADDAGLASDAAVLDFLAFALQRKIDVNQIWIAETGNRIYWALLPIASPGRTMLLFTPNRLPRATPVAAVQQLTEAICRHWGTQGMQLAQFLLDPQEQAIRDLYVGSGFESLAELIYLQKSVAGATTPALPEGMNILPYESGTHARFARTILRTYENSLDCPSLNGRRSIDDVILGHQATGLFDGSLWHLLIEQNEERGVMLLSPSQHSESIELVYLGLCPEARHRGLGDWFMKLAMSAVANRQRKELSLAVDSKNVPALRLYYRHGLKRIGSRLALVRDLH